MKILICSVNWLGDCIMTMPAIQVFRSENPEAGIDILVKEKLKGIWQLHNAIDNIITYNNNSTIQTAKLIQSAHYDQIYILPNSFRTALIPFLAQVPKRTAVPKQLRSLLINDKIRLSTEALNGHQALEYMDILGLHGKKIPPPSIKSDTQIGKQILEKLHNGLSELKIAAIMPGAAYGPAKMWPTQYFIETAELMLANNTVDKMIILGTASEYSICEQVASAMPDKAYNLAGKTNLCELTSLLSIVKITIANDSGGMHLATACGTKVVGIFGITDPYKTGPIGPNCLFITNNQYPHSRDIPRQSELATECLKSITPHMVIKKILELE